MGLKTEDFFLFFNPYQDNFNEAVSYAFLEYRLYNHANFDNVWSRSLTIFSYDKFCCDEKLSQ